MFEIHFPTEIAQKFKLLKSSGSFVEVENEWTMGLEIEKYWSGSKTSAAVFTIEFCLLQQSKSPKGRQCLVWKPLIELPFRSFENIICKIHFMALWVSSLHS